MEESARYVDPVDVRGVNERIRSWAAPGETIRPIGVDRIVIDDDAIDALVDCVRSLSGGGRTLLVADHTPMVRAGEDLKGLLQDRLARAVPLTVRRLPDDVSEAIPRGYAIR